jgi:hypothetical protein
MALLAVLAAAEATASDRAGSTSGQVQLTLSPSVAAALNVDARALAEAHCGSIGEQSRTGECHLVVRPDGITAQSAPSDKRSPRGSWRVTGLELAADPVVTSCGVWDVSLRLDTTGPQSALSTSAGSFAVKARLHLANPATGEVADLPLLPRAFGDDPYPDDCLPDWIVDYPDLLKKYQDMGCQVCGSDVKRSTP